MSASVATTPHPAAGEPSPGRAGFGALLRSEWTKFRTVRGWPVGLLVAGLVTILFGMITVLGSRNECSGDGCGATAGPTMSAGRPVVDRFTFVHRPLTGDGSLTVRVVALTGSHGDPEPWAKAGLMIKQSTTPGAPYAAILLTGGHGVRMQSNFTADVGATGADQGTADSISPRWLRISRTGNTITGEESADGTRWNRVGSVELTGLGGSVPGGMFVTSPDHVETVQRFGGIDSNGETALATAVLDGVTASGGDAEWTDGEWTGTEVGAEIGGGGGPGGGGGGPGGAGGPADDVTAVSEADGTFTINGMGDIAPAVAGAERNTIERSLVGVFAGLIVIIVIGTAFISSEYRRGLIRTTFAATTGRAKVVAAKALVLGAVTFVTGLVASALAVWIVGAMSTSNGVTLVPVSGLTELRVIVGTAGLLAVTAVIAMALAAILRRAVPAVVIAVVLVVLPYILAVSSVLPAETANWLLRITPAAGFAIQQSTVQFPQVDAAYLPATGYFPLSPFGGFAVLAGWAAAAIVAAVVLVRRRDA